MEFIQLENLGHLPEKSDLKMCEICYKKVFDDSDSRNDRNFACISCRSNYSEIVSEVALPKTSIIAGEELFNQLGAVDRGKKSRKNEKQFECEVCYEKFQLKSALKLHVKTHDEKRQYKCERCEKVFNHMNLLNRHNVVIHNPEYASPLAEKPFPCVECGKSFTRRTHLNSHVLTHLGVKPYSCSTCSRNFSRKTHLTTHMKVHLNEKPKTNQDRVKPFKCEHCDKAFARKSHLRYHVVIHTGERNFACEECDRTFSRQSHLREHVVVHSQSQPFQCKFCEKYFSRKSYLNDHINKHCGLSVSATEPEVRSLNLSQKLLSKVKHKVKIKKEKPKASLDHPRSYKCEQCDKSFKRKPHLRDHMLVHTGERNFKCEECSKTFKRKTHLRSHTLFHARMKLSQKFNPDDGSGNSDSSVISDTGSEKVNTCSSQEIDSQKCGTNKNYDIDNVDQEENIDHEKNVDHENIVGHENNNGIVTNIEL